MLHTMTAQYSMPRLEPSHCDGLEHRYLSVRGASLALIEPLEAEDCQIQTIPEVSPAKWHIAHTTWFFERFCLMEHAAGYSAFDSRYLYLFNSYYYSVGAMHQRVDRGLLNRPLLSEVLAYREHVDAAMLDLIETRGEDAEFAFLVTLGLHHEQQHQELMLTDIKHVFFTNPLNPAYRSTPQPLRDSNQAGPLSHGFIERPAERIAIGHCGSEFCFDNETPRHDVLVNDHAIGNRLVTNAEYLEFVREGGYEEPNLWLADAWSLLQTKCWSRPLYWSEDGAREFTLDGWQPLDAAAPVCHVSYYEADAYARWAGARLPSEAEWEYAAAAVPVAGNTLDTNALHPHAAAGEVDSQPQQLFGDVWEWTQSPYMPYPGFRPLAGSLGEYNGKFMANQMVVRGGSCATWAAHLRPTYRSFFYARDRWQLLGFRLAKDSTA